MGVAGSGGAYTYMLNAMGEKQAESEQYYYPPGQQPAMDFAEPELAQQLAGMQLVAATAVAMRL